jgi:FADH2-dependent halogenase/halogenation protein CepH
MKRYDVTVLGGGPAGAAAARMLALWGHRVLLLTRPPRGPALAESLTPSCGKLLEQIGVRDAIDREDFVRSTGHTVKWGDEPARVELFGTGERGWQLLSDDLDRVLLREARRAGAAVHRHANVRSVVPAADGDWRVTYEERDAQQHVSASWVIDCTGRSGLMSRAGSGRREGGLRTMAMVGVWERRPHWALEHETHTYVESYSGGWAWSVPVSRRRRQVTVMVDPSRTDVAHGRRLPTTYREELARAPMIHAMTSMARPIGTPWARDASPYACDAPASARLLVAGDAASFVDPLSSFGVKKAMASGWLAAVAIHSVYVDPSIEDAAMRLVAARERSMVAGLQRQLATLARDAAQAHPTGFWGQRADGDPITLNGDPDLSAFRSDPSVQRAFNELRAREQLAVVAGAEVSRVQQPMVEGHTVVLREHLVTSAFPDGLRYLRNVDVTLLAGLAPSATDVPTLYEAYCARAHAVPITDVVSALAVLIATGIVRFS